MILWSLVLGQREILHASVDERFHAVVDLRGGDDRAAALAHERRAAAQRLSRVADVIDDQHTAAMNLLPVKAAERLYPGGVLVERRKHQVRVSELTTALEQPGHRMGEQRASGGRTGDHVSLDQNRRRQHLDQILGKTPDAGWMTEKLMRMQVDLSVIAVAEVEVPIQHQHFVFLKVLQGLLSDLVDSLHLALSSVFCLLSLSSNFYN